MNHAVILRTSVAIATLSVLQAVLPAVILGASLALIAYFRDVPLDRLYITLAILAMVLTATLLRPASTGSPVLQLRLGSLVMDVLLRWGIIVAILLALGFAAVTASSAVFAQQQDFSAVQIQTQRLADNLFMLVGEGGNIALSTGADGSSTFQR